MTYAETISRGEAKEAGLKTFFGKPCKCGHVGKRYVSSGGCVDCKYIRKGYDSSPRANPSRNAAKARGDKRFWSDVPCKNGHVGDRFVSNYLCCQCARDSGNRIELARREQLAGRPRPQTCEVCGKPPTSKGIVWDHNHETGAFRGWLCSPCNVAIGMAKDDPDLLRTMADYLEIHSEPQRRRRAFKVIT